MKLNRFVFGFRGGNHAAMMGLALMSATAVVSANVDIAVIGVSSPSASDVTAVLPVSLTEVPVGESFFVEVWTRTTHAGGLAMVSIDLGFPAGLSDVLAVQHTALFGVFPAGSLDNTNGLVDNLSGSHAPASPACSDLVGVGAWARLASVQMLPVAVGTMTISADPSQDDVFVVSECGSLSPPSVTYGSTMIDVVASAPPSVIPDPSGARTRYLAFAAPLEVLSSGSAGQVAIEIVPLALQDPNPPNPLCCPPKDFSAFESATCTAPGEANGCSRWVGRPRVFSEQPGNAFAPTYVGAALQCEPFYHDFASEGPFVVFGAEIVPSSTYDVYVYGSSCKGVESTCVAVSLPTLLSTRRFGDIAAPYSPPQLEAQPDALDIVGVVNKFRHVAGAPLMSMAQVQPNVPDPNRDVNAIDIVTTVDSFRGFAYPYSGPCSCPSSVVCRATACASASGCGTGLCVRTCIGGSSPGEPCFVDAHCPAGGVCESGGFCTDGCGRCRP